MRWIKNARHRFWRLVNRLKRRGLRPLGSMNIEDHEPYWLGFFEAITRPNPKDGYRRKWRMSVTGISFGYDIYGDSHASILLYSEEGASFTLRIDPNSFWLAGGDGDGETRETCEQFAKRHGYIYDEEKVINVAFEWGKLGDVKPIRKIEK